MKEWHIYGNQSYGKLATVINPYNAINRAKGEWDINGGNIKKVGEYSPTEVRTGYPLGFGYTRDKLQKNYELKDHLGNVRAVINDVKEPIANSRVFRTNITELNTYFPFGMKIKDLSQVADQYRAYPSSFNGMREDNELKGEGNSLDFGARFYDPRYGKFLSLDPLYNEYPNISPYAAFANNPVIFVDPDGRDFKYSIKKDGEKNVITITVDIFINNQIQGKRLYPENIKNLSESATERWNEEDWVVNIDNTEFEVIFEINYQIGKSQNAGENDVEMRENKKTCEVRWDNREPETFGNLGIFDVDYIRAYSSHETGHFLGLINRYSQDEGKPPAIHLGWKGNIMAEMDGIVEMKNINAILKLFLNEIKKFNETQKDANGTIDVNPEWNEEVLETK